MKEDSLKFTIAQAKKIDDKKTKPKKVIARAASDMEMEQFLQRYTQPVPKRKGFTRKGRSYWSGRCTWELKNGKPVMFDDVFINPVKLDISSITKGK